MILVDYTIDHPVLRDSLAAGPDATLQWIRSNVDEAGDRTSLYWLSGVDPDAFEAAAEGDPTVGTLTRLATEAARHLYRIRIADTPRSRGLYALLVEVGGVVRDLEGTAGGWTCRLAFPSQTAGSRFFSYCRDRDLGYEIHAIYDRRPTRDEYGLTDRQRETLEVALASGYLEIPRDQSLEDLATELDISPNAASERFRRGVRQLLEQTVGRDA
jgi:hypothetical protein